MKFARCVGIAEQSENSIISSTFREYWGNKEGIKELTLSEDGNAFIATANKMYNGTMYKKVYYLAVLAEHRRKGLAEALLRGVETPIMYITTYDNYAARRLCEKLGFRMEATSLNEFRSLDVTWVRDVPFEAAANLETDGDACPVENVYEELPLSPLQLEAIIRQEKALGLKKLYSEPVEDYRVFTEEESAILQDRAATIKPQVKQDSTTEEIDTTSNNGGPTDYYDCMPGWTGAGDIIEGRGMNFNQGTMFKVTFCFNVGRHSATTYERELNKLVYFANRELKRIKSV